MTFHHVGIPATHQRPGEIYLDMVRLHITDANTNPYHVEWLRFEPDSPMPAEVKAGPHVAFMVDDLHAAIAGKKVLVEPFVPVPGLRVAFINDDEVIVELMEKIG